MTGWELVAAILIGWVVVSIPTGLALAALCRTDERPPLPRPANDP